MLLLILLLLFLLLLLLLLLNIIIIIIIIITISIIIITMPIDGGGRATLPSPRECQDHISIGYNEASARIILNLCYVKQGYR